MKILRFNDDRIGVIKNGNVVDVSGKVGAGKLASAGAVIRFG